MSHLVADTTWHYVYVNPNRLAVDDDFTAEVVSVNIDKNNNLNVVYLFGEIFLIRDVFFLNGTYSDSAVNKLNCYFANSNLPSISGIRVNKNTVLEELPKLRNYLDNCMTGRMVSICRRSYKGLGFYNEVRFI